MKLSIIVPVYNERNTIREILKRLEEADLGVEKEIIIVDDYSIDGTREIIKNYENRHKIFYHDRNCGKGCALRTGFAGLSGDWVAIQDADLEYDPNDFKIMLAKAMEPGVAVVYGSRRGHQNYFKARRSSHAFAIGGIFLTWLTNLLYGTNLTDEPTCYKMFKAELLPELNLQCRRFEFCPEFTAKVAKKGIKIHEVPINYYPRHKDEGKKINWRDGLEAIWVLLKYKFKK
ncbi:MAG: Glycosyl transferase family 2 [Parcubacteria group bacterium GW2011_GWC2_42_6]|nr:MAG: Glycosyl transferase family 2 [Parcubacteria group bacterium GW2011_GWA2_42_11]KKS67126.1 MAG: Glycosyl transferase family 2 [Parcubacteria group bacterium GW2011_GWC2_42_6]